MEILNFFREDPVMAWLVLLGLLLVIVSVASTLWQRVYGLSQADAAKQIALVLAVVGWIRSAYYG